MISKRIGFVMVLLWLLIPAAAFGQSWLDVSPGVVFQAPGSPSCYTITVGEGAYMSVDLEYYYENNGPYYTYYWPSLDGNGQAQVCVDGGAPAGSYVFTGVRNSDYYWTPFVPAYVPLTIASAPLTTPAIYNLGSGGDNWDSIWIGGARFQQDSFAFVYSQDGSANQVFWGPAWVQSPAMWVSGDGTVITLQITDPAVRNSFGNSGVYVQIVNPSWNPSEWVWTHSPPPVIYSGDAGCADLYCIWLSGSFPLNATVDFREHGQSNVIPNSYTGLNVTASLLSLQLNAGSRFIYDTAGLDVWVVNTLFPNWSGGYYLPPKERPVIGNIDGVVQSGLQYYITGWACAQTYAGSIDVHVYVGGPAGAGTFAVSGTASMASEPALAVACNSTGSAYRFSLPIPHSITQNYGNQPMYVHGISPFGLANSLIGSSGIVTVPAVDRSVTGFISGVVLDNQEYYLRGWACAKTNPGSIDVHLYAGGSAGSGTFVTYATANQSSNPTATSSCNTGGTNYGFSILLSLALRQQFGGQPMFVHGISPFALANLVLDNSGNLTFPPPVATSSKEYIYIGDRLLAVDTTNLP